VRDFKGVSPKAFDGRGNYTLACASRSSSGDQLRPGREEQGLNVSIGDHRPQRRARPRPAEVLGMPFGGGGAQ
jgi:ribosomal protein L5